MNKANGQQARLSDAGEQDQELDEQKALLKAFCGTVDHFFGGFQNLFRGIRDGRHPEWIQYPLAGLLSTGVLMFLFRLGARRQVNYQLRGNSPSQTKFEAWFGVDKIPHGDTLNYAFKRLAPGEVQEVVCWMVETLIRKKVLYDWRLYGNFLVAIDGTGALTFRERHCDHCLTRKLNNGERLYYHPVLEAKLVTANGFAFSLMTEFIENVDPQADKQDCELKAFYRLSKRLKARFPRLPLCLLLDGLFAGGPTFQICHDYNWRYLIVLQEADLPQVHRTFDLVVSQTPENHKKLHLGQQQEICQDYRWVQQIDYLDVQDRHHILNVLACQETKPARQGDTTTTFKWLTNLIPTAHNVDILANRGGRLRWKVENEGFNIQKNGGFHLEHPYSQNDTARKVFYYLLQIAHLLFQLMEKGSLFCKAFPQGVGSLKNIAFRLLEAWRNLRLSPIDFCSLYNGRYQIRFDTS
ncbi:MAG: hypothetical protein Q8K93_31075 [Reyranella sp.]|nr:hypothetical protein [Reyranella sp.]